MREQHYDLCYSSCCIRFISIGCLIRHFWYMVINQIMYSHSVLLILKLMLNLSLSKNTFFCNVVHYSPTWQCCTSSARTWITDWGPPFTPNRSSSSNASRAAFEEQRRKVQLQHYKCVYFFSLYPWYHINEHDIILNTFSRTENTITFFIPPLRVFLVSHIVPETLEMEAAFILS